MRYFIRTGSALIMALTAIFVVLPEGAQGEISTQNRANIAGWLVKTIEDRVRTEFSGPGREVKSVKVILPKGYTPPLDYDSLEINIPRQNRLGSRVFLNVTFMKGMDVVSRVNAMTTVKTMVNVVVAKRNLMRGVIINEEDIEVNKRLSGSGYNNVVTDPNSLIGKQLDRKVRSGSPILSDSVSKPLLVRSGDVVTIVARSGSLTVTTLGKAREDGDRGEWITIINIQSKKVVNAQVVGPGQVRVTF